MEADILHFLLHQQYIRVLAQRSLQSLGMGLAGSVLLDPHHQLQRAAGGLVE